MLLFKSLGSPQLSMSATKGSPPPILMDSHLGLLQQLLGSPLELLGFPCGSAGKESSCNVGDLGSIPGLGRSPGEGKGYPLQYSGLETSIDCIVHVVAESDKTEWLSLLKPSLLLKVFGDLSGRPHCSYSCNVGGPTY